MQDKKPDNNDLDVSAAARGIWLVKVPKYLSEQWHSGKTSTEVGKLRIAPSKVPGGKPEVVFSVNQSLASSIAETKTFCPTDHKFIMSPMGRQNCSILSQTLVPTEGKPSVKNLAIEGKVTIRAECQPIVDSSYIRLKRQHMVDCNKPTRQIQQLDTIVNNYKPVSDHKFNIEHKRQKQEIGKKSREDRDVVKERLFAAFEKHQYYYLRDLERLTNQPTSYLKEILREICVYNLNAPHRNMWELKPELRHYKPDVS